MPKEPIRSSRRTALGTEISRFGCCRPSRRLVSNSSTCTVRLLLLDVLLIVRWPSAHRLESSGSAMKRTPKLGQHFLVDDAARVRIADALGVVSGAAVVEIGPGH